MKNKLNYLNKLKLHLREGVRFLGFGRPRTCTFPSRHLPEGRYHPRHLPGAPRSRRPGQTKPKTAPARVAFGTEMLISIPGLEHACCTAGTASRARRPDWYAGTVYCRPVHLPPGLRALWGLGDLVRPKWGGKGEKKTTTAEVIQIYY